MADVTRRAAWRDGSADGWHDDLVWYAAAVHQMKLLTPQLPEAQVLLDRLADQGSLTSNEFQVLGSIVRSWSDPESLGYQSQVHASLLPKASWPSHAGRQVIWHQCAHNSWFFLPWHRAFLLEFESVARAHIQRLGGPAAWGLPYWNYSDYLATPAAPGLPLPMQGEVLPDGVEVPGLDAVDGVFPNPLFDPSRTMQSTSPLPEAAWADASEALQRPHFSNRTDSGRVSFGGGVLEDLAAFHRANEMGKVDLQPHGSVHGEVGGNMGGFVTAGLDPVFWLHHCNVDRLWETYATDLGHGFPFEPDGPPSDAKQTWDSRVFEFLRNGGQVGSWTAPQVLHLEDLGYEYDTTAPPQFIPTAPPPRESEIDPFGLDDDTFPEPIAAANDVALAGPVDARLSGGDAGAVAAVAGGRWVLRLDGIRAGRPAPTSYQVFLGPEPDAEADSTDLARYVGLMSLFGVFEASVDDGTSAASGRVRVFDVTAQLALLGPSFDVLHPVVRFVPLNPDRDLAAAAMSIERITLEVAS